MRIKGFDKDLKCCGMQYKVGEIYDTGAADSELELCSNTVIHYSDSILGVHEFYPCDKSNRYCEIEVLGKEIRKGIKFGSNRIRIVREITGEELQILIGKTNGNSGLFNSGMRNTGDGNTGDRNTGSLNTGNWNIGSRNTGDKNTGNWNTGNRNTGNCNAGDFNAGNFNTGRFNTGIRNTGDWNTCNGTNGFFCTEEDRDIRIFNKPSGMSAKEFRQSSYYSALKSAPFPLIVHTGAEGETSQMPFKGACAIWWENMTEDNRQIVRQIPNFDADIFFEITGINAREEKG